MQHWNGTDEKGRAVSIIYADWKPDYAMTLGTGVVYSQAEGGRQARLVSTVPMARGLPLYLPGIVGSEHNSCQIRNGRLDLNQ